MTIREQSELGYFAYLFKVMYKRNFIIFIDSAKEAYPFFFNLGGMIISPFIFPYFAYVSRKRAKEMVAKQDKARAEREAVAHEHGFANEDEALMSAFKEPK